MNPSHSFCDPFRRLAEAHSWPADRPNLPEDWHGWDDAWAHDVLAHLSAGPRPLVLELGAWLGRMTAFVATRAPEARIITVDTWAGSPEHLADPALAARLPTLFDQWAANLWPHRDRIMPMRMTTLRAMRELHERGVVPSAVWIDADHREGAVAGDLAVTLTLWPRALVGGHDWSWPSVREGVGIVAAAFGKTVIPHGSSWRIE